MSGSSAKRREFRGLYIERHMGCGSFRYNPFHRGGCLSRVDYAPYDCFYITFCSVPDLNFHGAANEEDREGSGEEGGKGGCRGSGRGGRREIGIDAQTVNTNVFFI